ncbi:MAG: shikimate dehydrogenase [Steroidobacterales bacterium]
MPEPDAATADQYGIIGHPIGHSWSPFIHGIFAQQTHQNLVYRLFDVEPEDFEKRVVELFAGGVRGLNVTIPHKQAAARIADQRTDRAMRARAVNTLVLRDDGTLLGDNTDGVGLINDLTRNLHFTLRDKRVLMLGAGGAARGVMGPLLDEEVWELTVANRTPARARALCAEFFDTEKVASCGFLDIPGLAYDLIINATAASLHGEMPVLPAGIVGKTTLCYDMAYGRGATPFTAWAEAQHAGQACKGWGMLVEQAAVAFELWRGIHPDTEPVLQTLAQYR